MNNAADKDKDLNRKNTVVNGAAAHNFASYSGTANTTFPNKNSKSFSITNNDNKQYTILLCDDEAAVHETLGVYFADEHLEVIDAYDGKSAIELFRQRKPDLILLDLMIPGSSGTDICREIRRESNVPIIMLSAKGEEIDRIIGLELGADDYIVKPFNCREVVARIKAVMRRSADNKEKEPPDLLRFDQLEINLDQYQVKIAGEPVAFTPKEVEIIYLLASHAGQVLDRETILAKVWGIDYYGDTRTVDTHIKRIRQKIMYKGCKYSLITVYGIGYKFDLI